MTARQFQVLRAIRDLTEPRGPTVRELCATLGLRSTCTGQRHLEALERKGLITMSARSQSRGVKVTPAGEKALEGTE